MIRTWALELQGVRAGGAWEVRLGAGIPCATILPLLTADKPKGSLYADGLIGTLGHLSELVSYTVLNRFRVLDNPN